jgi:glycosyltransferase involved in cell wall biosynthesis
MSETEVKGWSEKIMSQINQAEIVVFQRPTELSHLKLMKYAKDLGKKIVQTADDNYIDIPEWNSGYQYYSTRQGIVKETFRLCDAMDVTTPALKKLYSEFCPKVEILPNSIDVEILDYTVPMGTFETFDRAGKKLTQEQYLEKRAGKKLILWGGSPTHEKDLELIVGAARRLSRTENVVFAFVGYVHKALLEIVPADRLILIGLVPAMQYYSLYKGIKADIGLAPVVDVPFNHGKSNLKAIEYAALRVLPVMSDIVTYQGAAPRGIYSKNDELSWYSSIIKAIHLEGEELKSALDENRKFMEDNYDIKKNVTIWETFYGSLL